MTFNDPITGSRNYQFPNMMLKIAILLLSLTAAAAADSITGAVHNQTTGKPSAGDEVVLMKLGEGMQQESRATTDAQGAFSLNTSSPGSQHLIQVSHQGVNYDQPVSGNGPVDILVYDVAATVPGLSGPIGIAQVESDGKTLKVTEMYDIANTSNPPLTQVRANNFEISLPPRAAIESVDARRGQGIWLKVTPVPSGKSGRYGVNFPIRPGDTLFKVVYRVPYQGPTTLRLRLPYPIQKFAVMHPASITFRALRPDSFRSPGTAGNLTVEQAVASPLVGDVPAFEVSGVGIAPEHGSQSPAAAVPATPAAPSTAPAVPKDAHAPLANEPPAATPADKSRTEAMLMIVLIVLIVAGGGFMLWRLKGRQTSAVAGSSGQPLLDALKEELFQLESDRARGSISEEEYAASKQALNKSIERLARNQ